MKYFKLIIFSGMILSFLMTSGCKFFSQNDNLAQDSDSIPHIYMLDICVDSLSYADYTLQRGENLSTILNKLGFSSGKIDSVGKKANGVFDITKLKAGQNYSVLTNDSLGRVEYLIYENSLTDHIVFDLRDTIRVYEYKKEITNKTCYAKGVISSSLWGAIDKCGADPMLALMLSEIYAWQVDFFGIGKEDWFKVVYDQSYIDDSIKVGISNIKGAEFNHLGKTYYAIPFAQDSIVEWYDENGRSLKKAFLKAPLKFSRISSNFSHARRHPILKIYRPHHGIDYAAPKGTPVMAIGAGVVVKKAFQRGGAGNYLVIKHNSTFTTTYMHLSKFGAGVSVGTRINQGHVIGYVGSSGLSSGPHLDFRVHKNGTPINPLKLESPPSHPVRAELMDSFNLVKKRVIADLERLNQPVSQSSALMPATQKKALSSN